MFKSFIKPAVGALLLACLLTPAISTPVSASTSTEVTTEENKVGEGYTADGVYYEVFEVYTHDSSNARAVSTVIKKDVMRIVRYSSAYATPASYVDWQEYINGDLYTGRLFYKGSYVANYVNNTLEVYYYGTILHYTGDLVR